MFRFIVRRFLWMMLVLFVVSLITFILMHSIPGGPFAREGRQVDAAVIAALNRTYNLDQPLPQQYVSYVGDVVFPQLYVGRWRPSETEDFLLNISLPTINSPDPSVGPAKPITLRLFNFGPSFQTRGRSVTDIIRDQFPISAQLGVAALVVALVIGMPIGIAAALKRNTPVDYVGMGIAIVGVSVPVIVMGPFLRYLFGVQLGWLPVSGWGTAAHYVMPAFALGFTWSAIVARLTRASLLQILNEDFIRTARAKGLAERMVVLRHALKNSLIPVVTVVGPLFAALVTGSLVAEQIFAVPGIGGYFVTSITNRDYTVIMGTILLYATILVLANLLVDVVYAWLDPRIRYS